MAIRGISPSRTLRLTEKGLSAIAGRLELLRAPCIGCGIPVSLTRFGAFTGPERHSSRQCAAIIARRIERKVVA